MPRRKETDEEHESGNENESTPPGLLNENQVAKILGVSPDTVRSWRTSGRRRGPRFLKVSARCVRYRREAIEAFLAEIERKAG